MNHGSFRSKRTTDTPYGSLRGTHKLVAGGVWVSRGGSLWQHVSIYGLCQAWWAVLCWECWQIPWMFSGFCVCKTWIKDTDSELNEVLTIFLYRGLSCWTKSSRLCSLNCTSTKTSSVVSLLGWLAGWHAPTWLLCILATRTNLWSYSDSAISTNNSLEVLGLSVPRQHISAPLRCCLFASFSKFPQ